MSTDPIAVVRCGCGWPRPLVAVTRSDGQLPMERLSVRYDCPTCGAAYVCGELAVSTAASSARAHALAAEPSAPAPPVDPRVHFLQCAYCLTPIAVDPERLPEPGTLAVCACGGVSAFEPDSCVLRKPTREEADALQLDARVRAALVAVSPWLKN